MLKLLHYQYITAFPDELPSNLPLKFMSRHCPVNTRTFADFLSCRRLARWRKPSSLSLKTAFKHFMFIKQINLYIQDGGILHLQCKIAYQHMKSTRKKIILSPRYFVAGCSTGYNLQSCLADLYPTRQVCNQQTFTNFN